MLQLINSKLAIFYMILHLKIIIFIYNKNLL